MAGQKLKLLRTQRKMTVRDVEQASRRIAADKGDKRFCISNSWLAQLENGASSVPDSSKLFSLGVIYRVGLCEVLRLFGIDVNEQRKYEVIADPDSTQLLPEDSVAEPLLTNADSPATTLLHEHSAEDPKIVRGRIGSNDMTMSPLIRPGSIVEIDTRQNKLQTTGWTNEFDRPVYFIELRDGWVCSWCELEGNELRIIPHPLSGVNTRLFKYKREAEIVGRVVAYYTRCIDDEPARNTKQRSTNA